jgi:hypothetical protein
MKSSNRETGWNASMGIILVLQYGAGHHPEVESAEDDAMRPECWADVFAATPFRSETWLE